LLGLEFANTEIGYKVVSGLFRRGVLVAGTLTNSKVVRIEPALNVSIALVDKMLDALEDTLKEIDESTPVITLDQED
jgi:putrescine aminotransferase